MISEAFYPTNDAVAVCWYRLTRRPMNFNAFKVQTVVQRQGSCFSAKKTFAFRSFALCRLAEAFVITSSTVKTLQIRELFVRDAAAAVVVVGRGICDFYLCFVTNKFASLTFPQAKHDPSAFHTHSAHSHTRTRYHLYRYALFVFLTNETKIKSNRKQPKRRRNNCSRREHIQTEAIAQNIN